MSDSEHDSQIEKIAALIAADRIPLDEQDGDKLKKYIDMAKTHFHLKEEASIQLVNEAFLYLKLKATDSLDLLQHGDKFGAGFS